MGEITRDTVSAFLRYDLQTGQFTRKRRDGTWTLTGGVHKATGYCVIGIGHKPYLAHRLAFLLMTGSWPVNEVDHINGDRADNRWCNLRDVTSGGNKQNRKRHQVNNAQQLLGVSFWPARRGTKKYVAQLSKAGKRLHCSYHETPEAAHAAYVAAKRQHHQEGNTL